MPLTQPTSELAQAAPQDMFKERTHAFGVVLILQQAVDLTELALLGEAMLPLALLLLLIPFMEKISMDLNSMLLSVLLDLSVLPSVRVVSLDVLL
jgi:hypothetical protein